MRKAVKIGFIGVFCAVIGLAFPVFNIFSKQLSMDSHENRLMTGLPQVLQSPLRELPRNLDNFLVDNSPFRYQFVLVNAVNKAQNIGEKLTGKEEEAPAAVPTCPFCLEEVKEGATRCPHCAGQFDAPAKAE